LLRNNLPHKGPNNKEEEGNEGRPRKSNKPKSGIKGQPIKANILMFW